MGSLLARAGKLVAYLLVAALGFSNLTEPAVAQKEKRVALVIGNSGYKNVSRLTNPKNDSQAVAAMLKRIGFDVVDLRRDMPGREMRAALSDFSEKVVGADIAVIYFAGHGLEIGGTNFLAPVDAAFRRDIDVEDEGVALNRLLKVLEPAARLRLVILDACRDNPFVPKMKRVVANRSLGRGLAEVELTGSNTLIAYAAKAGSTADDGKAENSPFTAALVRHLAEPGLDLRLAFGRVRDEVMQVTGNKQEPVVYGSLGGAVVSLAPGQVDPDVAMRADFDAAAKAGTLAAWERFLAAHQQGYHVELARAARLKLIEKEKAEAAALAATPAAPATAEQQRPRNELASLTPEQSNQRLVRSLQSELRRVGCHVGSVDGNWTSQSRFAVENFNRRTGTAFDANSATEEMLGAVRAQSARVCPLVCADGYRADGERCVVIACPSGQLRRPDGTCEARPQKAAIKPSETRRAQPERRESGGTKNIMQTNTIPCDRGAWPNGANSCANPDRR